MTLVDILTRLLDVLVPPRHTETLVRELTHHHLRPLVLRGEKSGSLPYHDERVMALVWEVKYHANPRAARVAGLMLSDVLIAVAGESLGTPLLIPVPMHARRRRERGHNQTEVLCEAALPHMSGFYEYAPGALMRLRHTQTQQSLHKHERAHNIEGSMEATSKVFGRVCVVVDDVSTTGATFKEAARALRARGAARVECIALAYS